MRIAPRSVGRYAETVSDPVPPTDRRLLTAELLSIGSELLVGETRDTNAGELARSLTDLGIVVGRATAFPDRLDVVETAFADALSRVDLVVSTGGLGPTPDDLTREAIARVCGETPVVDPDLERWLRELWARRRLPFPEANVKQAWVIPSALHLPNPNGTAPGWLVTRPDGRVLVAMPGPPREMRPMWHDEVVPRLRGRPGGLGAESASHTLRLTGIGESQVAEILGEAMLRATDPEVATYARAEAVDIRISATTRPDRSAEEAVAEVTTIVMERLGSFVWATGATTWSQAIGSSLAARGWTMAVMEIGTRGQVGVLLGDVDWLPLTESRVIDERPPENATDLDRLQLERARAIRIAAPAEVGLAVAVHDPGPDPTVHVAVVTPDREVVERRAIFLGGSIGRTRAALTAAAIVLATLRETA